jgi:hypothetical protein
MLSRTLSCLPCHRRDIEENCLVAPFMGDDGGDEERFDLLVDTGRWRELKVSETQTDRQTDST